MWNTNSMKQIAKRNGLPQTCKLAYSTESNHLISAHGYAAPEENSNFVKIWNGENFKEEISFRAHAGRVLGLAMDPTGRNFVTGSADGKLKFWNLDDLLNQRRV